jgi:hypothetical protein
MQTGPYENVKNQIGYCGLWCGSCIVGNGTLKELTQRYERLITGYGVDEWGAKGFDSKEFMKGLASIQNIPVCRGCLKGGGNEECRIRPCAVRKKMSDCCECGQAKTCENSAAVERVRSGALAVGMLIKTSKGGRKQLMEEWNAEIRRKFLGCLLDL